MPLYAVRNYIIVQAENVADAAAQAAKVVWDSTITKEARDVQEYIIDAFPNIRKGLDPEPGYVVKLPDEYKPSSSHEEGLNVIRAAVTLQKLGVIEEDK